MASLLTYKTILSRKVLVNIVPVSSIPVEPVYVMFVLVSVLETLNDGFVPFTFVASLPANEIIKSSKILLNFGPLSRIPKEPVYVVFVLVSVLEKFYDGYVPVASVAQLSVNEIILSGKLLVNFLHVSGIPEVTVYDVYVLISVLES